MRVHYMGHRDDRMLHAVETRTPVVDTCLPRHKITERATGRLDRVKAEGSTDRGKASDKKTFYDAPLLDVPRGVA